MHKHVLCDWSAAYLTAVMFHVTDEAVGLISTNKRELQHKDTDTAGRHSQTFLSLLTPPAYLGTLTDNL